MEGTDKSKIVADLKRQLARLVELYERVKEENISLSEENRRLIEQAAYNEAKIEDLSEQLERSKLSHAFALGEESRELNEVKHDAKIKINRLIKEIDNCISLLNNRSE